MSTNMKALTMYALVLIAGILLASAYFVTNPVTQVQVQETTVPGAVEIREVTTTITYPVEVEVIKEVPAEVVVVREVPQYVTVEKTVTQEVIKEAPLTLREFASPEELRAWVKENRLYIRLRSSDGVINFDSRGLDPTYNCNEYARDLQLAAFKAGYILSVQLINGGSLLGQPVTNIVGPHAGLVASIGNAYYYVESIPPHEVRFITYKRQE